MSNAMDRVTDKAKDSGASGVGGGASPFTSDKDPLQYDPMLGWYTAATLSGLLVLFLACVGLEKIKDKIVEVCEGRDASATTTTTTTTTKPFDALHTDCVEIVVDDAKSLLREKRSSGSGGLTPTEIAKSEENVSLLINTPKGSTIDNYVYMTLDRPNHLEVVRELDVCNPLVEPFDMNRASPNHCSDFGDEVNIQKIPLRPPSDNLRHLNTSVFPPFSENRRSLNLSSLPNPLSKSHNVIVKDETFNSGGCSPLLVTSFYSSLREVRDENVTSETDRVHLEAPFQRDKLFGVALDPAIDESSV